MNAQSNQAGAARLNRTPTPRDVGEFIEQLHNANPHRVARPSAGAVAARCLDEMVEVCLAAGLSAGDIYAAVGDSLANQASKVSHARGATCVPSNVRGDPAELGEEIAGTCLVLKHLAFCCGVDWDRAETEHWAKFTGIEPSRFYTDAAGSLRVTKAHVLPATGEGVHQDRMG
jgi:hypothetical protein